MKDKFFYSLVAIFLFFLAISVPVSAGSYSVCANLNSESEVATLSGSVSAVGSCFNVTANHVILDCQGNTITYSTSTNNGVGVNITSAFNVTVQNCNIVLGGFTNRAYAYAIETFSSNNTQIINNNITGIRNGYNGNIEIYNGGNMTKIQNNTITINSTSQGASTTPTDAIDINNANNMTVTGNVITIDMGTQTDCCPDGVGVWSSSSFNNISSNTITITSLKAHGIGSYYNGAVSSWPGVGNIIASNRITIKNNTATASGTDGLGVLVMGDTTTNIIKQNDQIVNNTIICNKSFFGVEIRSGVTGVLIENNSITMDNGIGGSNGIMVFDNVNGSTIKSNNVTVINSGATNIRGIQLGFSSAGYRGSYNSILQDNIVDTDYADALLMVSGVFNTQIIRGTYTSPNTGADMGVLTLRSGIQGGVNGTVITGSNFTAKAGGSNYALWLDSNGINNNTFWNSTLGNIFYDTCTDTGTTYLKNTTYGVVSYSAASSCILDTNWYLDVLVRNRITSAAINGAVVNITNSTTIQIFNGTTGANGRIGYQFLPGVAENSSQVTRPDYYTINGTASSYNLNSTNVNLTASMIFTLDMDPTGTFVQVNGITNGTYPDSKTISCTSNIACMLWQNGTDVTAKNSTAFSLAAGLYNFTASSTGNQTTVWYNVSKASPSLSISGTGTFLYPTLTSVLGSGCPTGQSGVSCYLYRGSVQKTNPENATLGVGTYTYVFNTSGGVNYTSGTTSSGLTITAGSGQSLSLTGITNGTYPYSVTPVCTGNVTSNLYLNDSIAANSTAIQLAAGNHLWTCNTTANENYTYVSQTVDQQISIGNPYVVLMDIPTSPNDYTEVTQSICAGPSEIPINLYRNASIWNYNNSNIILPAGDSYFVCNTTGNANYTANSTSEDYIVNQGVLAVARSENISSSIIYGITANITCTVTPNTDVFTNVSIGKTIYRTGDSTKTLNGTGTVSDVVLLGVGSYSWNCTGNDVNHPYTSNWTTPTTGMFNLSITQADPNVFQGFYTANITYGAETSAYCVGNNIFTRAKMYRNSSDVDSTENGYPVALPAGTWYYTCNDTADQNFTAGTTSGLLIVDPASQSLSLTGITNHTHNATSDTPICTGNVTSNLYLNDSSASAYNGTLVNFTAGDYIWKCNTTANANYTFNSISVSQRITEIYGQSISLTGITNGTYPYPVTPICTGNTTANLYLDYAVSAANNTATQLRAGNHLWTCNTTANENYTFSSISADQSINKGVPTWHIAINGTEANTTYTWPTAINVSIWVGEAEINSILFQRNGVWLTSGYCNPTASICNDTDSLPAGIYNYTGYVNAQNYTGQSDPRWLTLESVNAYVNGITNGTYPDSKTISCTSSGTSICTLWQNGVNVTDKNASAFELPAGLYNFTSSTPTNGTTVWYEINKGTPTWHMAVNGTEYGSDFVIDGNYPAFFNVTVWTGESQIVNITFTRNGTVIGSCNSDKSVCWENTTLPATDTFPPAGTTHGWNYTAHVDAQNYTGQSNSTWVRVFVWAPSLSIEVNGVIISFSNQSGSFLSSLTGVYPIQTNVTGICPSELTCNLYRNDTNVTNPEIDTFAVGSYDYAFNTSGNSNYTDKSITTSLTVDPASQSLSLTGIINDTYPYLVTPVCTGNVTSNLYLDDSTAANSTAVQLAAGNHKWKCNTTTSENYTFNSISVFQTITPADQSISLTGITNGTYPYPVTPICTGNTTANLYLNDSEALAYNGTSTIFGVIDNLWMCNTTENLNYTLNFVIVDQSISQGVPTWHMAVNDSETNFTGVYPVGTNVSIWTDEGINDILFFRNETLLGIGYCNPTASFCNDTEILSAGDYNYTGYVNQNYTQSDPRYVSIESTTTTTTIPSTTTTTGGGGTTSTTTSTTSSTTTTASTTTTTHAPTTTTIHATTTTMGNPLTSATCRLCPTTSLNKKDPAQYLYIGMCLITNIFLCSQMAFSLAVVVLLFVSIVATVAFWFWRRNQ